MQDFLTRSGVLWRQLDCAQVVEYERQWRDIYASIFIGRPRLRHGTKAELEYASLDRGEYLIVPFLSKVTGLPIDSKPKLTIEGYACNGEALPLGRFFVAEFFVSPPDFEWTMIHTHEDHGYGGPYFVRAEWIPSAKKRSEH